MSDIFDIASDNMLAYYEYKRDSDSNKYRPMWFTNFAKWYDGGFDVIASAKYSTFLDTIDATSLDDEAFKNYQKNKQTKPTETTLKETKNARLRLNFVLAVNQAFRRQFTGANRQPGVSANSYRYERDRKTAAAGMLYSMQERIKKKEE